MVSHLVSTSGHLQMQSMKLDLIFLCVPAQDLTSTTLEFYLHSSVKTTSVKLEPDENISMSSILMIPSGMVRDVGV